MKECSKLRHCDQLSNIWSATLIKRFTLLQSASLVRQFQGTMTYRCELKCPPLSLALSLSPPKLLFLSLRTLSVVRQAPAGLALFINRG